MFTKFIDFSTKNEQDAYLQSLISTMPVKSRRPRKQEGARLNQSTFSYSVSCSSGKFSICKNAFVNIHGITHDRVRRLCLLLRDGKIPQDMRGQNRPGNAIPGATVEAIKEHISSFPVKQAHYSSREYRYLSEQLNVKIMHNLFKKKHPEYVSVKYDFYLKVFHEAFSLTFGRPKVDTCCECETLKLKIHSKSLNDTAKRVAVAEKMVHLRRARKFYTKLDEVTNLVTTDDTVFGICIDYMQNLQLPSIPIQEAFYLRQLVVNVFCIHNLKDNSATFYVYNEGTAGKGPNEVCSFLIEYLRTIPENIKYLHIFSDGCLAQNKNNTMVRMFMALVSLEKFQIINQYFPIRGHSFLPCDRDFGVVKRSLKKFDHTYTLEEYTKRISECPRKQKFTVKVPKTEDILDFKQWWPKHYKKTCVSAESQGRGTHKDLKVSFKINQFMHFTYSSNAPNKVTARNFIEGMSSHTFLLQTSKDKRIPLPEAKAYTGPLPINRKKMDNLKTFQKYLTDDPEVQNFWDEIYTWPTKETEDEN